MTEGNRDPLASFLARYFRTGDAAAMEEVVRRTRARLLRIATRICGAGDAEDVVQAAYHALLCRGPLPGEVPPTGWLVSTVVRMSWRQRARSNRFGALAERLDFPDDMPGPVREAERSEEEARLRAAVARLPARYRDPLVLHHLQGLSVAELAKLLELPVNTVKTRLRRGRRLLEGRLASLAVGILMAAWVAGDVLRPVRAWASVLTGGAVNTKATVGIGLIILVSGTAGFTLGNATGTDLRRTPAARVEAPPPGRAATEEKAPRSNPPGSVASAAAAAPTAPEGGSSGDRDRFRERLEAEAERLGVSGAALQHARLAIVTASSLAVARRGDNAWQDHHLAELQEAVDRLRADGEQGFFALVAVVNAGSYSETMGELLARLCEPKLELHILRGAAAPGDEPFAQVQYLDALSRLDARGSERVVRSVLSQTRNPLVFVTALKAAATKGLEIDLARVEECLKDPDWASRRADILGALAGVDGPETAALLRRLGRDLSFPLPGPALAALAEHDAEAAKAEAAAILDGPRAAELRPMQLARLRVLAGRW